MSEDCEKKMNNIMSKMSQYCDKIMNDIMKKMFISNKQ